MTPEGEIFLLHDLAVERPEIVAEADLKQAQYAADRAAWAEKIGRPIERNRASGTTIIQPRKPE